jgi:hypothetical protein
MYRHGFQVIQHRAEAVEERVAGLRKALRPALRRHLRDALLQEIHDLEQDVERLEPRDDAAAWLELEKRLEQLESQLELAVEMGWHLYRSEARGLRFGLGAVALLAGAVAVGVVAQAGWDVVVTDVTEAAFTSTLCADAARCGGDVRCVKISGSGICRLRSHSDCRGGVDCRVHGRCSAVRGRCEATATIQCRSSALCAYAGRCVAFGGRCVAASDKDCRRATVCQEQGRCRAFEGSCQQSTEASIQAVTNGGSWSDEIDYRLGRWAKD